MTRGVPFVRGPQGDRHRTGDGCQGNDGPSQPCVRREPRVAEEHEEGGGQETQRDECN